MSRTLFDKYLAKINYLEKNVFSFDIEQDIIKLINDIDNSSLPSNDKDTLIDLLNTI